MFAVEIQVTKQGGFTNERLVDTIGLSGPDIEKLCSLPEGYMSTELAAVIPLNSPVFRPPQTQAATPSSPEPAKVIKLPTRTAG